MVVSAVSCVGFSLIINVYHLKLVKNDKTYMASVVRFAFTSKKGIVFPKEVIEAMGQEYNPCFVASCFNMIIYILLGFKI